MSCLNTLMVGLHPLRDSVTARDCAAGVTPAAVLWLMRGMLYCRFKWWAFLDCGASGLIMECMRGQTASPCARCTDLQNIDRPR